MARPAKTKKETDNILDNEFTVEVEVEEPIRKLESTTNNESQKVAELEAQLEEMKKLMQQMMMQNTAPAKQTSTNNEVTIVSCATCSINTPFNTWTLNISRLGQKAVLTREQFAELVNNHRKYFEREYIAVDPKCMDVAQEFGVPVYDNSNNTKIMPEDIAKFGKMTIRELEDYYNNLSEAVQRTFIQYFMNKCYEQDPDFYTVEKMTLLNNLTKGHLFDLLIQSCLTENQTSNR